jgi:hypothetical protein
VPFRRGRAKSRSQIFRVLPILKLPLVTDEQALPVAERPIALPPEFEQRVMHTIGAYNAAAAINLADYAARANCLRRGTRERVTATQKAIDLSQALIANIDALVEELASELTRKGWLWPAYRSAPSEPEMEAEALSAAQWLDSAEEALLAQLPDSAEELVARWRDSAQEALVRAETMRDPDARRMMRELAMHYETLALRVENATLALRVENTALSSAGDPQQ